VHFLCRYIDRYLFLLHAQHLDHNYHPEFTIPASRAISSHNYCFPSTYLPLSRRREHLVGRPDLVFTRYQTVTKVVLLFSLSPLLSLPWGLEFVDHAPFEGLGGGGGGSFVPPPSLRAVHRPKFIVFYVFLSFFPSRCTVPKFSFKYHKTLASHRNPKERVLGLSARGVCREGCGEGCGDAVM
jgi:hypothetical protein